MAPNGASSQSDVETLDMILSLPLLPPKPTSWPSFCPDLKVDTNNCVVRAIKIYLAHTEDLRKGRKRLFLAYKPGHTEEIKPATISSWIIKTVCHAYDHLPKDSARLFKVRAHDIQVFTTSWNALQRVSLHDILRGAQWRSHTTFTSFYFTDLTSPPSGQESPEDQPPRHCSIGHEPTPESWWPLAWPRTWAWLLLDFVTGPEVDGPGYVLDHDLLYTLPLLAPSCSGRLLVKVYVGCASTSFVLPPHLQGACSLESCLSS